MRADFLKHYETIIHSEIEKTEFIVSYKGKISAGHVWPLSREDCLSQVAWGSMERRNWPPALEVRLLG